MIFSIIDHAQPLQKSWAKTAAGGCKIGQSAKGKTKMREKTQQKAVIPTVLAMTDIREKLNSKSAKGKTKMRGKTLQEAIIPTVLAMTEIAMMV